VHLPRKGLFTPDQAAHRLPRAVRHIPELIAAPAAHQHIAGRAPAVHHQPVTGRVVQPTADPAALLPLPIAARVIPQDHLPLHIVQEAVPDPVQEVLIVPAVAADQAAHPVVAAHLQVVVPPADLRVPAAEGKLHTLQKVGYLLL